MPRAEIVLGVSWERPPKTGIVQRIRTITRPPTSMVQSRRTARSILSHHGIRRRTVIDIKHSAPRIKGPSNPAARAKWQRGQLVHFELPATSNVQRLKGTDHPFAGRKRTTCPRAGGLASNIF